MELRKILSEAEARSALAAAASSGLPRRAWARSQGLDPRSLNAWRLNLDRRGQDRRRQSSSPHALHLVELLPLGPTTPPARYTLEVYGIRLEVGDDFAEDTLRRLLGVLRGC